MRLLREALEAYRSLPAAEKTSVPFDPKGALDPQFDARPPKGGLIVRVRAKVLGGYEKTENRWRRIFQNALSRDNLWITRVETQALLKGQLAPSLQERLARFHLVDNTRGEPPMWTVQEIREIDLKLEQGRLEGTVHLETKDGARGFRASLLGKVEEHEGHITRFDLVARGLFWGEGRYTRQAPKGKFPLAIAFTLADGSDVADDIPPQGCKGWIAGYYR